MWEPIRSFFTVRINKIMLAICLTVFAVMLIFDGVGHTNANTNAKTKVLTIGAFTGSYWDFQNGYSYHILDDAIKKFEKEHPDVQVRYASGVTREDYTEWLAEKMVDGKSPDVFFVPNEEYATFVQTKSMRRLDDLIQRDPGFSLKNFYEKAVESGQWNGYQYSIPYECSPTVMMVNRTLLSKAGISFPQREWTWDDFSAICQKIQENPKMKNVSCVNGYGWQDAFLSNNTNVIRQNGTKCNFTGDRVYQSITFLENLKSITDKTRNIEADFYKGNVVFQPMLYSAYRANITSEYRLQKEGSFDWSYIAMPAGPSGSNCAMLDVLSLAVSTQTRYPKEAWELLKTLTYDRGIQSEIFSYTEGISPLRNVTQSQQIVAKLKRDEGVDLNLDVISFVMKNAKVREQYRNYDEIHNELTTAIEDILGNTANVQMEQIVWDRKINLYLKKIQNP
ncbi:multiple sugar transport system substrate-binding protein [Lachnospiraceae bacterium C10]|nr:multiple sugar transport system substrate-binding protein [Lachnospiraceae bacterium C10]